MKTEYVAKKKIALCSLPAQCKTPNYSAFFQKGRKCLE